jgi:hypothetical protein
MKFVLTRSLFWDAFGKKVSKNLKIVWGHATLPKTGLSLEGTVGPLGIKYYLNMIPNQQSITWATTVILFSWANKNVLSTADNDGIYVMDVGC